jgi:hypothetical protein
MKPLSPDTHPDIERIWIDGIRKMSTAEKMRRIVELNRLGYRLALADVRSRYPDETEREWDLRVASRYFSADVMRKVFHWDPDEKGLLKSCSRTPILSSCVSSRCLKDADLSGSHDWSLKKDSRRCLCSDG